jgi:hypothetical protein
MADQTNTPQKDPPEGSREIVDRELARQEAREKSNEGESQEPRTTGRAPHEAKEPGGKTAR